MNNGSYVSATKQNNRFISFLPKEFDTPRFELAVPEFSRLFPDVSV